MGICEERRENHIYMSLESSKLFSSLTINQHMNISHQLHHCICEIKYNNEKIVFGFFCKIPFDKSNLLPVLVTKKELIEKNNIYKGNKKILINNKEYEISFDNSRKIYINEKYGIAIIEIKKSDNLEDIKLYLDIDNYLYEENLEKINNPKNVYILNYPKINNNCFSIGKIINIIGNSFEYLCSFNDIVSGCPIINFSNFQLIGIHIEIVKEKNFSKGILIKELIEDFHKKYENKNSINVEINNEDKRAHYGPESEKDIVEKDKTELQKNYLNKIEDDIFKESTYYLKTLFLSFYYIENLRILFKKDLQFKNNSISLLLNKYMKCYEKDYFNCINIINEIEKKINELDKSILQNINFEKLINFILDKLHEELNSKKIMNIELPKGEYDEKNSYKNFYNYYYNQNKSEIQNIFFGIKEIINEYNCCGLIKYIFDICKYIYFNLENIQKINNLQELITNWEEAKIKKMLYCNMCISESETLVQHKIVQNQEILIIIIENNKINNKIQIDFNKRLNTKRYEYELLCCIEESEKDKDFKIIYNSKDKWYTIKTDNNIKKEVENEIESIIKYPCVLYYRKKNKINKSTNIKINLSNISSSNNSLDLSILAHDNILKNNLNQNINNNYDKNNLFNQNNNNNYITFQINNKNINDVNINYNNNIVNKKLNTEIINMKKNINNNINYINNYKNNKFIYNNMIFNNNYNLMSNNSNINNNINYNSLNNSSLYNINFPNKNKNNFILNNNDSTILINNNNKSFNYIDNDDSRITRNKLNFKLDNSNMINSQNLQNNNSLTSLCLNSPKKEIKKINYIINNKNNLSNFMIQPNNKYTSNVHKNNNINLYKNYNQISYNNIMSKKNEKENKEITLYFKFKNGKELYLDVKENYIFQEVINQLENKYLSIKNLNIIDYRFNGKTISKTKTVEENGLKNNSYIDIIEK